jgi:hypothetical protein
LRKSECNSLVEGKGGGGGVIDGNSVDTAGGKMAPLFDKTNGPYPRNSNLIPFVDTTTK